MEAGMESTIRVRMRVIVRITNISPSMSIAVSANCHEYPMVRHTVNTKKALSPMPGASPNGFLAYIAIISVPIMAARAVEVNTALVTMPLEARTEKMLGLTARMYAIVRKVVIPAITSVLMLCFAGSKPKSFSNIVVVLDFCLFGMN